MIAQEIWKLRSSIHGYGKYMVDEHTTGLHKSEVARILKFLNKLVDDRNTMIVIEHNMDVVRNANWVVDLGPDGWSKGGQVMFEGTTGC